MWFSNFHDDLPVVMLLEMNASIRLIIESWKLLKIIGI